MRSSDPSALRADRRICYLVTSDVSARFLRGQLGFLIEHDFDVHVGSKLSDPPAPFDPGVTVHDLPFEREPSPLADLRALWTTIRLIRALRPDIVNASTPKAGLLGTLAARACGVPRRVYVVRGIRFETMTGARRALFRLLERLVTASATDVVFNSHSLLEFAERERAIRPGHGRVLGAGSGNGVDITRADALPGRREARHELGIDADASVIGFVGRLTRDKGVADLVEAWRAMPGQSTLLLVGEFEEGDPLPVETRAAIASTPGIVHLPWLDDPWVAYRAMDILAFPSFREGLPNVPLEAQLCGTPVVGYAATGTIDAVTDGVGGRLVRVGSVADLAHGLDALLADDRERHRLGELGREDVIGRFDRHVVWRHLLGLLDDTEQTDLQPTGTAT